MIYALGTVTFRNVTTSVQVVRRAPSKEVLTAPLFGRLTIGPDSSFDVCNDFHTFSIVLKNCFSEIILDY